MVTPPRSTIRPRLEVCHRKTANKLSPFVPSQRTVWSKYSGWLLSITAPHGRVGDGGQSPTFSVFPKKVAKTGLSYCDLVSLWVTVCDRVDKWLGCIGHLECQFHHFQNTLILPSLPPNHRVLPNPGDCCHHSHHTCHVAATVQPLPVLTNTETVTPFSHVTYEKCLRKPATSF